MFRISIAALLATALLSTAEGVSIIVNATVDSHIGSVGVSAGSQSMSLSKGGSTRWIAWNVGTAYRAAASNVATGYTARWTVTKSGQATLSGAIGDAINLTAAYTGCTLSFYGAPNVYTLTLKGNRNASTWPLIKDVKFPNANTLDTTAQVTYDQAYPSLPHPTATGYTFSNWYDNTAGRHLTEPLTAQTVDITSSRMFWAQWKANTYRVTLKLNNGAKDRWPLINAVFANGAKVDQVLSVTYGKNYPTLVSGIPSSPGYTFKNWYNQATGKHFRDGVQLTDQQVDVAQNNALWAQWKANTYRVTLKLNNGAKDRWPLINAVFANGAKSDQVFTVTYGNKYPTLVSGIPSSPGYTFKNWYNQATGKHFRDGVQLTDQQVDVAQDNALWAQWKANEYTISFDRQSGSGGSSSATATYGTAMPSIAAPTRSGYSFGGYYTARNGGGTQYYDAGGAGVRAWDLSQDTTLYAKWTADAVPDPDPEPITPEVVTITFDPQGGAGGDSFIKIPYGSRPTGQIGVPEREGYKFEGYYTESSGGGTMYWDGELGQWDSSAPPFTSDTTLYAHWSAVPRSKSLGAGIGTNAKMNAVDENVRVAISTTSNAAYVISWSPDLRTNNPPRAYQVLHSPKLPVKESDWEELPVPEHPDWVVFPFDGSPNHFFKVKLLKKED